MDVTQACKFIGFGAMDVTEAYKFTGFGVMAVTKPYIFTGFGAMYVTRPCRFIGFGAMDPFHLPSLSDTFYIFTCGSGPENGHETALELVSGANFGCVLHHFSSPTRWNGSRGQVLPETGQKTNK